MRLYRVLGVLPFAAAALVSAGCAVQSAVSGLRPVYPEVTHSFGNRPEDFLDWTKVNSLQPTFRWQAFPGEHQTPPFGQTPFVAVDPASVRDVRYDLRIWTVQGRLPGERDARWYDEVWIRKVGGRLPGDPVYEIDGLTEPSHKLKRPLKPNTEYYWSVRARFSLDGQPRVSEWSLSQVPHHGGDNGRDVARQTGRIPPENYYRFKTPAR